jgi:hypothetical protein
VARWETTRPPSGYSLLRLADFARANRQLEIAEVFQTALYLEDPARNLFLGFKPQPAALSALEEIRSIRVGLGGEYLKVLRALERAHARMLEVFSPENENYREWQRTHQELKWEIEDEEKRQKKKG